MYSSANEYFHCLLQTGRALYYEYKALPVILVICLELPSDTERNFAYAIIR